MVGLLGLLSGTSPVADTTQYTLLPSMPSPIHKKPRDEDQRDDVQDSDDPDAEFGGSEARNQLEKNLLWKLDLRMSILIVIYILNYARSFRIELYISISDFCYRLTEIMHRQS
jgi:hypothetical protein